MKRFLCGLWFAGFLALGSATALALPSKNTLPPASSWIEWNRATERVVSAEDDTDAAYPRAGQLSNGEILLAYHHGDGLGAYGARVALRRSRDGGLSWYQTAEVDGPDDAGIFWGFSNPDFIELGGGRMLLVSAARGKADPDNVGDTFLSECQRSGLRVRFSDDYGVTWSAPRMLAAGRGRLWEPSLVRRADGELDIFFADESPALPQGAQSIDFIRSLDAGRTWSEPVVVSQDPGCRNGMPAALVLADGHIVCAQEVVGLKTSPWIAETMSGQNTDYRLAQSRYEFGAAPFLVHAPDGGTLLAFHSRHRKLPPPEEFAQSWMFSQIFVERGDAEARDFGPASHPWPAIDARAGAFFPSLFFLNDGTLVALASFITLGEDNSSNTTVHWIEGRLDATAPKPDFAPASPP